MTIQHPSRRILIALIVATALLIIIAGALWIMTPTALAQNAVPTVVPTVTPWGGRRGVTPGGAAPLFPYWLASLPLIALLIALIVRFTRRTATSER